MSRTPAHYRIEYNGKKLRFNCDGDESEKIVFLKLMELSIFLSQEKRSWI